MNKKSEWDCMVKAGVVLGTTYNKNFTAEVETPQLTCTVSIDPDVQSSGAFDWSTPNGEREFIAFLRDRHASPERVKRVRRRVEDTLRKTSNSCIIMDVARLMGVKLD